MVNVLEAHNIVFIIYLYFTMKKGITQSEKTDGKQEGATK
jgi:hypothetical protein